MQDINAMNDFHFAHYAEYIEEGELYNRIEDREYLDRRGISWLDVAVLDASGDDIQFFYRFFYSSATKRNPTPLVSLVASLVSVALWETTGHLAWALYMYTNTNHGPIRIDTDHTSRLSKFFKSHDYACVRPL